MLNQPLAGPARLEDGLHVAHAENDVLVTENQARYIDMFCGSGTVFLGHVNPAIVRAIDEQLRRVWITGALQTSVRAEAGQLVESFFPSDYRLAGFYSTGMEAAEFALRACRALTGRRGFIGFESAMHGKSTATAYLGWSNDYLTLPDVTRLPYVPKWPEARILTEVDRQLADHSIAAVFIEPFQGSGGGHLASPQFFTQLADLCAARGTLLVVDEIFTGFHRTGAAFLHHELGIAPDVVLAGKAMGNGFPVSAVVMDRRHTVTSRMLPGSTYAGNALASAAITATLTLMRTLNMPHLVAQIERTVTTALEPLRDTGIAVRGRGALWVLELPPHVNTQEIAGRIIAGGVIVSMVGPYIRLLPPATVTPAHLRDACAIVREACLSCVVGHAS